RQATISRLAVAAQNIPDQLENKLVSIAPGPLPEELNRRFGVADKRPEHPLGTEAGDGKHQTVEQYCGLIVAARNVPEGRERRQCGEDNRQAGLGGYECPNDARKIVAQS